jgi:hypothetical protein
MPAKSEKQQRFMQAVANSKDFAKKVGVPQSVGREYTKTGVRDMKYGMGKSVSTKMASGGAFRSSANGIAKKGKTKAKQVKMANGGSCGMKKGK